MSVVLSHEVALAREVRRSMSADIVWMVQHYFRDEDNKRFHLKPFHIEMLRKCADESEEQRVILLEPAAGGKSTHVTKHYPLWLLCMNPNVQILLGCQTSGHAESRLSAIKAELEGNEELVGDFGPFIGDIWREDEINVAGRTVKVKDHSISTFGAGTSIMGRRATHVIGDDLVTLENSGPSVEEQTRANISQKWNDGIKKVGYPGKPLVIRVINTVVDMRDLIHELAGIQGHVPDDLATQTWRSTKGYTVIRRPALDERTMTSLWPEKWSVEELQAEKAEDTLSFLRRMQNLCIDPANLSFRREWFYGIENSSEVPGCVDWNRCYDALPQGDHAPRWSRSGGYDPAYREKDEGSWCAYLEVGFDRHSDDPRTYHVVDSARFRRQVMEQEAFLCERVQQHELAILHIEENAAQQWLLQLPRIKSLRMSGFRIEGHNTNVRTKYDPETGLPAMAGRVRGGKVRFPYGCPQCRGRSDQIIGEFLAYPQGATKDMMMALWMAILAAEKVVRSSRAGIIERDISPLLLRHGLSAANAEKFYPPRRLVN